MTRHSAFRYVHKRLLVRWSSPNTGENHLREDKIYGLMGASSVVVKLVPNARVEDIWRI